MKPKLAPLLLAASLSALGCGAHAAVPIGYEHERPPEAPRKVRAAPRRAPVPPDVVARAAGAVALVRLSDGAELSGAALGRDLLEHDAVCVGEQHGSAAHHYGEFWLLDRLANRAGDLGLEFGVGLEMWANRFQRELSAYGRGKLDEPGLLEKTEYEARWGYDFSYYRPLLEGARRLGAPLIALNAPRELTQRIAKDGLDDLDVAETRLLPELDLGDPAHRADFERRMKGHPGLEPGALERYYAAQVVWDETMAQNSAAWLDLHTPMRRLLIVAGEAHCQHSAIPSRIERRGKYRVASVLLASQAPADAREAYDYALIVQSPGSAD